MTKPDNPIDRLLQDRAQFVNWLTRLNSGADNQVPEAVRSRVRADYERRLEAVLDELRGHTATLDEQVSVLTSKHRELTTREGEYKEQLSEAEVRHMVGEYDEEKWDAIQSDLMKVVNQIRGELTSTAGEITRLTDVLNTIRTPIIQETTPPEPEPEPVVAPAPPLPSFGNSAQRPINSSGPRAAVIPEPPAPEPITPPPAPFEPVRPAASAPPPPVAEIPFRPAAPRPVPPKPTAPPKKEEVPGRTLWFPSGKPEQGTQGSGGGKLDELAFLKSVTGEAAPVAPAPAPPPAPKRPSGGFTKPALEPSPPPAPIEEVRPAASSPTQDSVKDRQSGQKTLKCGECGTLNRPTEWYCERCGAELAAL
jgi:hypothetical protein